MKYLKNIHEHLNNISVVSKNLFLTLVFVFATSFSFAGANLSPENAVVNDDCIGVTLSCGVTYDICNFSGTTTQLINSVLNSNNNVCGTNIQML